MVVSGVTLAFSGSSGAIQCACKDLFRYTVCAKGSFGTWSVIYGLVPTGASAALESAIGKFHTGVRYE